MASKTFLKNLEQSLESVYGGAKAASIFEKVSDRLGKLNN